MSKRCEGSAGLRSSGPSRADRQDQRHVGFIPRDATSRESNHEQSRNIMESLMILMDSLVSS
jgi:hypothetical protein